MEKRRLICGVHLGNRPQDAPQVQSLFSEYGCDGKRQELSEKLKTIEGVGVKQMVLELE